MGYGVKSVVESLLRNAALADRARCLDGQDQSLSVPVRASL